MVVLNGIEAPPIISNDSIQWIDVRVPLTHNQPSPELHTPPIDDASCEDTQELNNLNVLEIVQFDSFERFPSVGLHVTFTKALCPFASICKNEFSSASRNPYMLYTMSVDGVVCLIHLDNVTNYGWGSVLSTPEVEELNTHNFVGNGTITSIAATAGFVVIGKHNDWAGCFRLGSLESGSEGFQYELQEDALNFLDHFVTKMWPRRTVAPVKDLLCLEIRGRKLTFVLYEDGLLQVWDLLRCTRFFDNMLEGKVSGARFMRLWAGETSDSHVLPLAIQHQPNPEDTNHTITISLYRCHVCLTWRSFFIIDPSKMSISREEDSIIDVKLSSNNIWILERDGVVVHNLSDPTESGECNFVGSLEPVVAERLFQNSEHTGSDIFRLFNSVFPVAKEHNHNRVNSIFMRLLSRPGIFHKSVLGATFNDFNKHITDSELHSLDPSGVREEIISIIEHEEASRGPHSFIYCWKNFCSRYFHNWCHENAPCGLLLDSSTGAIGLIRNSSVSLLRRLSDTEILSYGSLDEIGEITRKRINLSSDLEQEVLLEVLRCTSHLSQQLGNAAPAIFYECSLHKPLICPEKIVRSILKETDHNTNTKCSTDMLLSLHELYRKAGTWDTFVDVVLKYLKFLEYQKNENGSDRESVFESIFNILLLLNYMLKLSVQIHMSPDDVSRVQLKLIRPIQQVFKEWHKPFELPFISQFSPLVQTDSSTNQRPWDLGLRKRASRGTSSASQ